MVERRAAAAFSGMDSYRTYWESNLFSGMWPEDQEEDICEVESRVPLPNPFPFTEHLDENNSIVVNTSIFHMVHKKNGHILRVISKISLPTPPYSVSMIAFKEVQPLSYTMKRKCSGKEFELLSCEYRINYFASSTTIHFFIK